MLGYIAGQTDFGSYGLACVTAPTWHPIRLAEDLAILDHLTKGRLQVGFGRGVFHRDTAPFHPNADCRKDESRTLTGEVIDVVKKAWTEEFFAHQGPNYTFPPSGIPHHPWSPTELPHVDKDGFITKLCVLPKPRQRPHPPIWVMVASEGATRLAAEHGYNCIAAGTSIDIVRDWLALYAELRSKKAGRDYAIGECWAIQRPLCVARTMEEARQRFEPFIRRQREYQALYRGAQAVDYQKTTLGKASDWDWDVLQQKAMFAGTPDDVGERFQELKDLGIESVNVWTDAGGFPHDMSMDTLELFAAEVMPKFVDSAVSRRGAGMPRETRV
jgi:alkanesulfonate monooxygenase SsuD/methylene tetrahydromethanopterin reductase-like flavin-dependent oxidoreductase (luciferase family)